MIPDTVGATLSFLAFVAPGLLFELLRERRRPSLDESTFREAGRVALTSLLFTIAAITGLYALGRVNGDWFIDPTAWAIEGTGYLQRNLGLVARSLLTELALAMTLAVVVDRFLRRRAPGRITGSSDLWFQVFRVRRPGGSTPWVHVKLDDGSELWGYVGDYTAGRKLDERELTIVGPKLSMKASSAAEDTALDEWSSVYLRGQRVTWMKVTYVADSNTGHAPVILPARSLD